MDKEFLLTIGLILGLLFIFVLRLFVLVTSLALLVWLAALVLIIFTFILISKAVFGKQIW